VQPPLAEVVVDLADDHLVAGVARERPAAHWDPLFGQGHPDHRLRPVRTVVLGVPVAAEVVVVLGLEVGAGGVEEQHVNFQIEQVGHREEYLPLDRFIGLSQEVHGPVEDLGVSPQPVHPGQGHVLLRPLQRRQLG